MFFSPTRIFKKTIVWLVIFSLFFQMVPTRQARAFDLWGQVQSFFTGAQQFFNDFVNTIPEFSIVDRKEPNVYGIFDKNPFDSFSLRSDKPISIWFGPNDGKKGLSKKWVIWDSKGIEISFTGFKISLPFFQKLDQKELKKIPIVKSYPGCSWQIPTKESQIDPEVFKDLCQEECQDTKENSQIVCQRKCQNNYVLDAKQRVQRACLELNRVQKSAAQEVYLAKQVYAKTDPLDSCFFLKNCRSQCQLTFGGYAFKFDVAKLIEWFNPTGIGIPKLIADVLDMLQKVNRAYSAVQNVLQVGTAIKELATNLGEVVHGFVNIFGLLANGSILSWTDKETWQFTDNIIQFQLSKSDALQRIDETQKRILEITNLVLNANKIGESAQWQKLSNIQAKFLQKFQKPWDPIEKKYYLGGATLNDDIRNILDFQGKELKNTENTLDDIFDFSREKNAANLSWFSANQQSNMEAILRDIQSSVSNLRGVEINRKSGDFLQMDLGEIVSKNLDGLIIDKDRAILEDNFIRDEIGIYGIKLGIKQTSIVGGITASKASALKDFLVKVIQNKVKAKRMLLDLGDIEKSLASLKTAVNGYLDGVVVPGQPKGDCPGDSLGSCRSDHCSELAVKPCRDKCKVAKTEGDCERACSFFNKTFKNPSSNPYLACRSYCQTKCQGGSRVSCADYDCRDACNVGLDQCRQECENNCPRSSGGSVSSTKPNQEEVEKLRDDFDAHISFLQGYLNKMKNYIGDDKKSCEYNESQFFTNLDVVEQGFFLNYIACFEKFEPEFFPKAKTILDFLEQLEFMSAKLDKAKESLTEVEPLLDTPSEYENAKDEVGQFMAEVDRVFTSPFDYINDRLDKISRNLRTASDLAGKLYNDCANGKYYALVCAPLVQKDLSGSLKELYKNYLGEKATGVEDWLNSALEYSNDIDQITNAQTQGVFSVLQTEVPDWYLPTLEILGNFRQTKWALQDFWQKQNQAVETKLTKTVSAPNTCSEEFGFVCFGEEPITRKELENLVLQRIADLIIMKAKIIEARESLTTAQNFTLPETESGNPMPNPFSEDSGLIKIKGNNDLSEWQRQAGLQIQGVDFPTLFQELEKTNTNFKDSGFLGDLNQAENDLSKIMEKVDGALGYGSIINRQPDDSIFKRSQEEVATVLSQFDDEELKKAILAIAGEPGNPNSGVQKILQTEKTALSPDSLLSLTNQVGDWVKKVMDAFALVIGIRSGYSDIYKNIAEGGVSDSYKKLMEAWQKVKELPDKIRGIWDNDPDINKTPQPSDEIITCKSAPAKGVGNKSGPQGGPVCPKVEYYTGLVNGQYRTIQDSLRSLELTRRIKKVSELAGFQGGKIKVSLFGAKGEFGLNDLRAVLRTQPRSSIGWPPEFNNVYQWTSQVAERARIVWALSTAMDFATKKCVCGQSFCSKYACLSDLPLTPQAPSNAYCWVAYLFRWPLYKQALKLEAMLEKGVPWTPQEEKELDASIDKSILATLDPGLALALKETPEWKKMEAMSLQLQTSLKTVSGLDLDFSNWELRNIENQIKALSGKVEANKLSAIQNAVYRIRGIDKNGKTILDAGKITGLYALSSGFKQVEIAKGYGNYQGMLKFMDNFVWTKSLGEKIMTEVVKIKNLSQGQDEIIFSQAEKISLYFGQGQCPLKEAEGGKFWLTGSLGYSIKGFLDNFQCFLKFSLDFFDANQPLLEEQARVEREQKSGENPPVDNIPVPPTSDDNTVGPPEVGF